MKDKNIKLFVVACTIKTDTLDLDFLYESQECKRVKFNEVEAKNIIKDFVGFTSETAGQKVVERTETFVKVSSPSGFITAEMQEVK